MATTTTTRTTDTGIDRSETIARIRKALRQRTGRSWSVTGGRGTVWGWVTITAPPARRVDGCMTDDDQQVLRDALSLERVHPQGEQIPSSSAYRREYINRAEGKPFETAAPYWD